MMSHLTYMAAFSRHAAASDPRAIHAAELRSQRKRRLSLRGLIAHFPRARAVERRAEKLA
jgi:hypothetical protein